METSPKILETFQLPDISYTIFFIFLQLVRVNLNPTLKAESDKSKRNIKEDI